MKGTNLPSDLSDEELMSLYGEGNHGAFEELFGRYERRVESFLRRRLSSFRRDDMNDLLQLSWLKLHQTRERFDSSRKFSSWFYGIIVNTLRDYYKQVRWKYETNSYDDSQSVASDETQEEERIITRQLIEKLGETLETLSEVQKEIILLSDYEGFSSKEISKMLNLSDTNVRQQLFRARKSLKVEISR